MVKGIDVEMIITYLLRMSQRVLKKARERQKEEKYSKGIGKQCSVLTIIRVT